MVERASGERARFGGGRLRERAGHAQNWGVWRDETGTSLAPPLYFGEQVPAGASCPRRRPCDALISGEAIPEGRRSCMYSSLPPKVWVGTLAGLRAILDPGMALIISCSSTDSNYPGAL